jgi:hypothetical protein
MKNQTAVEWLEQELRKLAHDSNHHLGMGDVRVTQGMMDELFEKAKEMERGQIENAFGDALNQHRHGCSNRSEYYNQTYGGEK